MSQNGELPLSELVFVDQYFTALHNEKKIFFLASAAAATTQTTQTDNEQQIKES